MAQDILIVGAGVAGLAAADTLADAGATFRILEATDSLGGRVKTLEGFADFPIELGAEEIHGPDNILHAMAAKEGLQVLQHFTTDDVIQLDGKLRFLDQAALDPDVLRAFDFIDSLGAFSGGNWTVLETLIRTHFPRRSWHYLDSRLGVEHGTTLDRLAMRGFADYERGWESRETNYTVKGRYLDLLGTLVSRVSGNVELDSPVASITWEDEPIVKMAEGKEIAAPAVILTASLAVLREGGINFCPALPDEKRVAMGEIGMDAGMKILLKFRRGFWDERMYFLHSDGFLSQFWVTGKGKSENSNVLTAFVGGGKADQLRFGGIDPVKFALGELDGIFGGHIATRSFEAGFVADWGSDPFVRGLYSYPTARTTKQSRQTLARPLDGKLFFAGEATDTEGHSGTVHGAMASGRRAAREVLAARS